MEATALGATTSASKPGGTDNELSACFLGLFFAFRGIRLFTENFRKFQGVQPNNFQFQTTVLADHLLIKRNGGFDNKIGITCRAFS
jgi:hypothetical protein